MQPSTERKKRNRKKLLATEMDFFKRSYIKTRGVRNEVIRELTRVEKNIIDEVKNSLYRLDTAIGWTQKDGRIEC